MLDTYIKNRGMTKTIIHNNNRNIINETNWDADYDGSVANISLDLSKNGRNKHFDFQLNNNDLANILTIPSVRQPIHKRLKMDFKKPDSFNQIFLEIEPESSSSLNDIESIFDTDTDTETRTLNKEDMKSIPIQNILTHISSPKSNEEFIIPFHNLEEEQPVIKIIHKSSKGHSKRHSHKSKSKSKSKRYTKTSKGSTRRIRHHNYPSNRKSPRRSHS